MRSGRRLDISFEFACFFEADISRVRRDPRTRPLPNFFSSTRPVPTRKLKMTGYRVIKYHFESNETPPRMKRTANKVTNPINPSTGNHFFAIYLGKGMRTGAVVSSQRLRPINLNLLAKREIMVNCSMCASQ